MFALHVPQTWSELDDGSLVEAYRTHAAEAAFAELVHRYQPRLFRVLVGMVNDAALAEELCQRTLVKAALNLDQLDDGQAFYAWLLRVARTQALDELRKYSRRKTDPFEDSHLGSVDPGASHGIKSTIRAVLGRLTPEERMAVLLADLEQRSIEEIAEILGTKESATKMRISRARARFRSIYQEMIESHGR